ncbi:hypothetical protein OC691_02305 ['Cleome sp.' phytoplasma]|uniref:Uncharacterized protein n=1 Tax='Vigna radiata' phytoplasma TaxID=1177238 RepID=A0ABT9CZL8_9MOLU|nr:MULTISPECIES: hypothetical protein [Phytoplasma]MDO8052780.1 hypothetical protein ['Vigna radiata' phytoplasma]MDO8055193.1 hypothetical protein ['Cleome sp.' phytoplasma]MDV3167691.1 hypothetical protein [Candidatus Phytoplasma australasiaticum]MDV3190201.1 hypothetical protein [Candidatus Phytoplasma australasiaticum]
MASRMLGNLLVRFRGGLFVIDNRNIGLLKRKYSIPIFSPEIKKNFIN